MVRLNLILLIALMICALSLVTSQYRARQLFSKLQQEQTRAKELEVEWGQLQLEQGTWAMRTRVIRIANQKLSMRMPSIEYTQKIKLSGKYQ